MAKDDTALVFEDRSAEITCPDCQDDMRFCLMSGLKCVGCPKCLGMLIDGEGFGELVRMLRSMYKGPNDLPKPPEENELRKHRQCPSCLGTMDTHPYYGPGNVVIDACRECKLVWLDRDEMGRIVRAPGKR
jgi:Zn-finger nucleic acid-binding protein